MSYGFMQHQRDQGPAGPPRLPLLQEYGAEFPDPVLGASGHRGGLGRRGGDRCTGGGAGHRPPHPGAGQTGGQGGIGGAGPLSAAHSGGDAGRFSQCGGVSGGYFKDGHSGSGGGEVLGTYPSGLRQPAL